MTEPSIVIEAEIRKLRTQYEEHARASSFHNQEANKAWGALLAAKNRLRGARQAEGLKEPT
jgi:hypothetical protein